MATYAIGDVQGCYDELRLLLDQIGFNPGVDTLWFTGDLVNRGPKSLETLRYIKNLKDSAITVLGNHDLHLLAVCDAGIGTKRKDTLSEILNAPDRNRLLAWLRAQPLVHTDDQHCLLHAGLPPQWDTDQAVTLAEEITSVLRAADTCRTQYRALLKKMYGNSPSLWQNNMRGWDRLRFIINGLTRMRYCRIDGSIDLEFKGSPEMRPDDLQPWFELPGRTPPDKTIVFGHWSTLGFQNRNNILSLDTGCVWGGYLTAFQVKGSVDAHPVSIKALDTRDRLV